MIVTCEGCGAHVRHEDAAPYIFHADRTYGLACRRCIGEWVRECLLWSNLPFWARRDGVDRPSVVALVGADVEQAAWAARYGVVPDFHSLVILGG